MTIGLASNQASPEVTVNQMVDGYLSKDVSGGVGVALTDFEGTYAVVELTGAITANIDVTVPDVSNVLVVRNNTTGSFTVTVKSVTGTGIEVPQGYTKLLYCDGTNVEELSSEVLKSLTVNDDHIIVSTSKTPATATDTGTAGSIAWDSSYIYVCVATNTWVRASLATW